MATIIRGMVANGIVKTQIAVIWRASLLWVCLDAYFTGICLYNTAVAALTEMKLLFVPRLKRSSLTLVYDI